MNRFASTDRNLSHVRWSDLMRDDEPRTWIGMGGEFDALADLSTKLLGTFASSVVMRDRRGYVQVAASNLPPDFDIVRYRGLHDRVLASKIPLYVSDVTQCTPPPTVPGEDGEATSLAFVSYVGIPLVDERGRSVGVACSFDGCRKVAPATSRLEALHVLAKATMRRMELRAAREVLVGREMSNARRANILQSTLDNIVQGIMVFDASMCLQSYNRSALAILRLDESEVHKGMDFLRLARCLAVRGLYGEGDPDALAYGRLTEISDAKSFAFERTLYDGRVISIQGRPLQDGGFLTTCIDVTAERAYEVELEYQTRLFRLNGAVSALANRAEGIDVAVQRFLQYSCDDMGYLLAHVSKLTPTGLCSTGWLYRPNPEASSGSGPEETNGPSIRVSSALARRALVDDAVAVIEAGELDLGDLRRHASSSVRAGFAFKVRVLTDVYVFEFFGTAALTPRLTHRMIIAHAEAALSRVADRERLDRLAGRFVDTIGTHLDAPLGSVQANIRGVPRAGLSEEATAMLDVTEIDSRRLRHLVDNLRVMRDPAEGPRSSALRAECVLHLLSDAVRHQGDIGRIKVHPPLGSPIAHTNADSVGHVLSNLLSNALKFSAPDSLVHVSIEAVDDRVLIEVRDVGCGIPASFGDLVFSEFTQADSSDTRRIGGTGLGLAVAKRLTDRMGGELSYESTVGEGTTFRLRLPAATADHVEARSG